MMPSVIPIPLAVLVHPSVPAFPSLARAHIQYGGIPVPVPPALFNGCMVIASLMDMDPNTVMAAEAKEFFLQIYDAAKGPHDAINPGIADAEPADTERLLERLDAAAQSRAKLAAGTDSDAYRREMESRLLQQSRYIANLEHVLQSVVVRIDKLQTQGDDVIMDGNKSANGSATPATRVPPATSTIPTPSATPATSATTVDDTTKIKVTDTALANPVGKLGNLEFRLNNLIATVNRIESSVGAKFQTLNDRVGKAEKKSSTPGVTSAQLSSIPGIAASLSSYQSKVDKGITRIEAVEKFVEALNSRFKALVDHTDKTEIKIVGLEDERRSSKVAIKVLQAQVDHLSTCVKSSKTNHASEDESILGVVDQITKNLGAKSDYQNGVNSVPTKKENETADKVVQRPDSPSKK